MRRSLLPAAIALALSSVALAQQSPPPAAEASVPLSYVATNARVSAGIDDDGNLTGEGLFVFGIDDDSAWLAQGWLGYAGAGGLQLDYHWLRSDGGKVFKVFGALDQNAFDDRKATLGFGVEGERMFLDAYVMGATTGSRQTNQFVTVRDGAPVTGVENGRPFIQQTTITRTLTTFEHPYDWGVGARIGRWFEPSLVRLRGGLDYESGDFDAEQFTLSAGLDKYFANSGHSVSLELEHGFKDGDFDEDEDETRAWLLWRYEFGQSFRPTQPYRMVEQRQDVAVTKPAEPVVVRNEVRMDDETFFGLDSAVLTEAERGALDELVATIDSDKRVSRVSVTGHTCDLGSAAYNQGLSERRAAAVREYLIAQGVDAAEIDVSGAGETQPRYPNDGEDNRRRNRRVDVGFLTVETRTETPAPETTTETKVEWVREEVQAPPAWIERALRNPAEHKRTVDVYRFGTSTEETTLGPRQFLNRGPAANPDAATTPRDTPITIAVLANDTDPDGDALSIASVTAPANGTAVASGTSVLYTPRAGFTGTDTFSYTASDGRGGTATATVTVTVTPPLNQPPVAVDDELYIFANTYALVDPRVNDSDPDGDPITIIAVTDPVNGGSVRINSGQTILYIPTWTWWGVETLTYTISDGRGGTATANIRIRVIDD